MKITVKLFATLRGYHSEKEFAYEVSEGAQIETVIRALEIPVEEVAIMMVNGIGKKRDSILSEYDVLALFPAVGGG